MKLKHTIGAVAAALGASPTLCADMEEVAVSARHETRTIDVAGTAIASPDVAELLLQAPGANVNRNGPLTGIPQYRGMFGPRIAVSLDGNQLAPAGPNWMDPPLSYAMSAQLASLEVYRGIAPVSVAQESLGGAVNAQTLRRPFGDGAAFGVEGRLAAGFQSASSAYQVDADLQASNRNHRFRAAGLLQDGEDARFPGGEILPSSYERRRYDLGYGFRHGDHQLQLGYGYNDTGESGTPALPMDIDYIEGDLYQLSYSYQPHGGIQWEAALFGSELDHGMTNFHLRQAPGAARWRRNIADSSNAGFRLSALRMDDGGSWRAGLDGFRETHNSDIDNPNNPMFFVVNFNRARRDILGAFLEREQSLGERWRVELGLRYNRVKSDAGEVDGAPAMMMPPAGMLRDAFNAADREQTDGNLDLLVKASYRASERLSWHAGLAQKQRSPAYQERYLWLPLEATGGLADGQLYIGDIDLDPERAVMADFGLDYRAGSVSVSPRLYYKRVDDYIQGTPLDALHPATMMVRMMNAMNGTNRPDPLQFSNVEATLYGFDMDWAWQLGSHWSLSGLVNYVRGERRDIRDDLYRIAPPNTTLRVSYARGHWDASLEGVLYASQDRVSETNRERESSGYGLVNLKLGWQATNRLRLAAGVDNLFDRRYRSHLTGYNRAANPDITIGERLPGQGLNLYAGAEYRF